MDLFATATWTAQLIRPRIAPYSAERSRDSLSTACLVEAGSSYRLSSDRGFRLLAAARRARVPGAYAVAGPPCFGFERPLDVAGGADLKVANEGVPVSTKATISTRSRGLVSATVFVGLLHHTDHVLRADHSGWPFTPVVTPFTFSLLAYPILLAVLFGSRLPLGIRAALLSLLTAFTIGAHTLIETPRMQYASWALNRSIDPALGPIPNLLCTQSPELGVAAVLTSLVLNLLLFTGTISVGLDVLRHKRPGDLSPA